MSNATASPASHLAKGLVDEDIDVIDTLAAALIRRAAILDDVSERRGEPEKAVRALDDLIRTLERFCRYVWVLENEPADFGSVWRDLWNAPCILMAARAARQDPFGKVFEDGEQIGTAALWIAVATREMAHKFEAWASEMRGVES
jgi:hypothetical protein